MANRRVSLDIAARNGMFILSILICLVMFVMFFGLLLKSMPILSVKPLSELLFSSAWSPSRGSFGFMPFVMGTFWVTAVALAIAVPLCVLASIYLSEYAHNKIREIAKPLIDLLAGIPSVVYGLWGVLVIVPFVKNHVAGLFGRHTSGYTVLSAGIVLAIMIFPVIIHVSVEVLRYVPHQVREASLAVGATKWQTIKYVVIRKAMPGIIAAVVLGLSRAFGETMAVLMVAGNVPRAPSSVFDPAYPLPALIANNYGEMLSVPLYESGLLLASLLLLVIVVFFNIISRVILVRVERMAQ